MTVLRQLRKAIFGETWALPAGVAVLLGLAGLLKSLAPGAWETLGGVFLLGGAILLLWALVGLTEKRPEADPDSPGSAP